jgi:predicted RNase H-like HicB family nuclease
MKEKNLKTYIFQVELEKEEDGRWSATIPELPGCNAWGYTKEEALSAIQENAKAYLETLIEENQPIPIPKEAIKIPLEVPAISVIV